MSETDNKQRRLDEISGEIDRLMLTTGLSIGQLLIEAEEICEDLGRLTDPAYAKAMEAAHLTLEEAKQLEIVTKKVQSTGESSLTKRERDWLVKLGKRQLERAARA